MQATRKNFVIHASRLKGIEDNLIKTQNGYIGAVRILGVDIKNYKEIDKNICMMAFGNVLRAVEIPAKYVMLSCRPDYSQQTAFIARREASQKNPERQYILQRMRTALDNCQKNTVRRLTYVLLIAPERELIEKNKQKIIDCFQRAKISASDADEEEMCKIYRTILNGGAFDDDITSENQ